MALQFRKKLIDKVSYEVAAVCDVNNDGKRDIVCGEYWYEAPDWKKHKMCDVQREGEYYDDFSNIPMDVNGNGFMDIVSGGRGDKTLHWRENPSGKIREWKIHDIDLYGPIGTIRTFDIDGDGLPEIIPNVPGMPLVFYKLVVDRKRKGTGRFEKFVMDKRAEHGLGFGDINGDGRPDIVLPGGWLEAPLEAPEERMIERWIFHKEFDLGTASIPIIVYDVNKDGLMDLIVGQAHAYGLHWWEQQKKSDGKRIWIKHNIDLTSSQYHDLQMADIDNDGEPELITGKRYRAGCGDDPGADDPLGLYYFKVDRGNFRKNVIDYGPPDKASGCGIHFVVADLNRNGWLDIIAPGKEGLYLFENLASK